MDAAEGGLERVVMDGAEGGLEGVVMDGAKRGLEGMRLVCPAGSDARGRLKRGSRSAADAVLASTSLSGPD